MTQHYANLSATYATCVLQEDHKVSSYAFLPLRCLRSGGASFGHGRLAWPPASDLSIRTAPVPVPGVSGAISPLFGQIAFDIASRQRLWLGDASTTLQPAMAEATSNSTRQTPSPCSPFLSHKAPAHEVALDGIRLVAPLPRIARRGGIRGLSSLIVLERLMYVLGKELNLDPRKPLRPCECFDMIAGTSTGGLIAIMLGMLRMTIKEYIDPYLGSAPKIFPKEGFVSGNRHHQAHQKGLWDGKV
ncbi:hypothetical protein K469DRAFT_779737 [Zopfia rhizophila CBS 207.26]|uniref:PNPLA domain-containing protein n=1 Tax=Zopfia rhizophila CBS 207.26 TaxID=1314779 RepID=A0A6A6DZD1_9PEZI|nr:hypothetical protein K469DRAFT_779737 [Zopfia rhizophila CBS 207.26]